MDVPTELTLIGRMALGTVLGYVIGFEREYRGKPAGERTFGLLALGSAAVTGVGVLFFPLSAVRVSGVSAGVGSWALGSSSAAPVEQVLPHDRRRRGRPRHRISPAAAFTSQACAGCVSS
jgi:hypothetical protein